MKITITVLVMAMLAGCADSSAPPAESGGGETSFDDVDVKVSETTGAILGVVVNDAIIPIGGATIKLTNTEHTATSDASGRFSFSDIPAATYFMEVTKDLHTSVQSSLTVVAGVEKPAIIKVQLNRLYAGEPYMETIPNDGFFTCTQAGGVVWGYGSSPCHSVCVWTFVAGCAATHDGCEDGTVCTPQARDFHADVAAGWQTQIWEMTWTPSASGTSESLGITVSTYKPDRPGSHWFTQFTGASSPLYGRLDCAPDADGNCVEDDGASGVDPVAIPAAGMTDMSYFMSVRQTSDAPAVAIDQEFQVYLTQFYYGTPPEDWSYLTGSPSPF